MMQNTAWCHGGHQDESAQSSAIEGMYNLEVEITMHTTIKTESDTHIDIWANINRLYLLTYFISAQYKVLYVYIILFKSHDNLVRVGTMKSSLSASWGDFSLQTLNLINPKFLIDNLRWFTKEFYLHFFASHLLAHGISSTWKATSTLSVKLVSDFQRLTQMLSFMKPSMVLKSELFSLISGPFSTAYKEWWLSWQFKSDSTIH